MEYGREDIISSLEGLRQDVIDLRQKYQEVNDYGKLNYVAVLGEEFIINDRRADHWNAVLSKAIELLKENE